MLTKEEWKERFNNHKTMPHEIPIRERLIRIRGVQMYERFLEKRCEGFCSQCLECAVHVLLPLGKTPCELKQCRDASARVFEQATFINIAINDHT